MEDGDHADGSASTGQTGERGEYSEERSGGDDERVWDNGPAEECEEEHGCAEDCEEREATGEHVHDVGHTSAGEVDDTVLESSGEAEFRRARRECVRVLEREDAAIERGEGFVERYTDQGEVCRPGVRFAARHHGK